MSARDPIPAGTIHGNRARGVLPVAKHLRPQRLPTFTLPEAGEWVGVYGPSEGDNLSSCGRFDVIDVVPTIQAYRARVAGEA